MKMKNLVFACALGLAGNSCMGMFNMPNPGMPSFSTIVTVLMPKQEKMRSSIRAHMPSLTNPNVIITTTLVNQELLNMSVRLENGNTFREIAELMNRYPTHEDYIYNVLWSSDIRNDNIIFGQALHMITSRYPALANTGFTTESVSAIFLMNDAKKRNRNLLPSTMDVWTANMIDIQLKRIAICCNNPTISVDIAVLLYNNPTYQKYITQVLLDSQINDNHIVSGTILCGLARESMRK